MKNIKLTHILAGLAVVQIVMLASLFSATRQIGTVYRSSTAGTFSELSEDTTPVLGGDLDAGGYDITNVNGVSTTMATVQGTLWVGNGSTTSTLLGGATSTFGAGIEGTALNITGGTTSTIANGIELAGGCFQTLDGNCLTSPAGSYLALTGGTLTGLLTAPYVSSTAMDVSGYLAVDGTASTTALVVNDYAIVEELATTSLATFDIDWSEGNQQVFTLSQAGHTMTFSNEQPGQTLRLIVCQDGTGSRTITTYDADVMWSGGAAPTLTTDADACDILTFVNTTATGTTYIFGSSVLDF